MNPIRTRLAAAALGAGLVIAVPAAAWAAGPRRPVSTAGTPDAGSAAPEGSGSAGPRAKDIESARARCRAAIETRLPALAAARTRISEHRHLTDDHEADLTAGIDATATRLRELGAAITADTDLAGLREHCRSLFEDNRVFALVLPRAQLVVGADTAGVAAGQLSEVAGKLAGAIDRAGDAGHDMGEARRDLARLRAAIASGEAAAGSVPGAVLGLTPADWNADHEVLSSARRHLREARAELKAARELARGIRGDLKPAPAPTRP